MAERRLIKGTLLLTLFLTAFLFVAVIFCARLKIKQLKFTIAIFALVFVYLLLSTVPQEIPWDPHLLYTRYNFLWHL